jgi:hypothetical protein
MKFRPSIVARTTRTHFVGAADLNVLSQPRLPNRGQAIEPRVLLSTRPHLLDLVKRTRPTIGQLDKDRCKVGNFVGVVAVEVVPLTLSNPGGTQRDLGNLGERCG